MPQTQTPEDLRRVHQRQKQIYFGIVTQEYWNYRANHLGAILLPIPTPQISYPLITKRAFDPLIREWRKRLHAWDDKPGPTGYENTVEWKECILPEIEQTRRIVSSLSSFDADSAKLNDYLRNIFFDVKKLIAPTKSKRNQKPIDANTFFSAQDDANRFEINSVSKLSFAL